MPADQDQLRLKHLPARIWYAIRKTNPAVLNIQEEVQTTIAADNVIIMPAIALPFALLPYHI